ncbi:hypothetical protein BDFB_012121 [Asbolus verrucosus]|uniref:Uncharacterized protein n=1 Tax=Asbolus verrucosus TaxID=1661398 RepID=A0A482VFV0_ASBVE|nr:hypothetical protein BDFB_012121 [Asbolus verrucosus]
MITISFETGTGRITLIVGYFQKREIPWEKVPFVPRPSLVPDPITAFGKKKSNQDVVGTERKSILSPDEKAKIKPKILMEPPKPYLSARDINREKILMSIQRQESTNKSNSMDVILPRLHKVAENPNLPYKRRIALSSEISHIY